MVDIKERLSVLFPDITFGADLSEADCVISNGGIYGWGRSEPQPTEQELLAVTSQDIAAVKEHEKRQRMVVTPWQFKKALTRSGTKRGQVNSFINNPATGDPVLDEDIKDGWVSASQYERLDDTVLFIQGRLGWTDQEVDDVFVLAATL